MTDNLQSFHFVMPPVRPMVERYMNFEKKNIAFFLNHSIHLKE